MRPLLVALAVLVAVSVSTTTVWFGHAIQTGVVLPEPDAPSAKAAYLAQQSGINGWLMAGAGLSWLVTFAAAVVIGLAWVTRSKQNRPGDTR